MAELNKPFPRIFSRAARQYLYPILPAALALAFFSGFSLTALGAESTTPRIELPGLSTSSRPNEVNTLADDDYFPTLINLIQNSNRSIDLAMFVFKTSTKGDNRPMQIAKALIAARQRGVRVRVILEKSGYDEKLNQTNEEVGALLKENRIVVEFDSPQRTNHAKLVVIDSRYCLVGSHNFTQAALKHNHELSLLIDSRTLARELLDYMGKISR
ncbi:MAG: phospholipase D-like domain-containing protein [Desulfobulbaceae bacterium]|nr:phospholipase D-like domain-containing protein [Desulfobulbaceae bacterium]HIJ79964.1 phospholipase [Deltaproteobacteria bacterium]